MDKDKKEVVDEMMTTLKKEILKLEIFEKYFTQKVIGGKKAFENQLGATQGNLKSNKELLEYLKGLK